MAFSRDSKRIMLIFPPSTSLASWEPMVSVPMGISYLAASLRKAGYEVTLLDAVVEAPYQETPINETISRAGLTYDEIMERVRAAKPDLVGVSCIFSNQWPAAREIARRVKAMDPDLPLVTGGAHPSFLSRMCMNDAPFDFILKGESERSFPELISRLREGKPIADIDGLVWREGEQIRENPKTAFIEDLDSLPFPAHDLLPIEKYFQAALPMGYCFRTPRNLPVVTSRGCPCRCTFCSSTILWGKQYRTRSAENVLAELDWLVDRFKIGEIKFQDDNLTVNKKRAVQIFEGMIERPYHLHWNTPNGIATWTLDRELLTLARKSGCWNLTFAVESGDQEVLTNLIKKPLKLEKVKEINQIARELGILRMSYYIIGFPGETRAQIMNTIKFARELKQWSVIFIYNPLPGSQLFEECVRRGYITEESFFEQGNQYFTSVIDAEDWTAQELESIIRNEYAKNYRLIFDDPIPVGTMWYGYFRYRPSFVKYVFLRSFRAARLALREALGAKR
jgi:anaerobic magnesium-protoporphyrin IX monomethyl ester cyclase